MEAIVAVLAVFAFYFVVKGIRGFFGSNDPHCIGEKPFYVFVITSEENPENLVSEINKLCTGTKGFAYVVMIVNDTDPYSDYNKRAPAIIQSLLTENRDAGYHPILMFKTTKEYRHC